MRRLSSLVLVLALGCTAEDRAPEDATRLFLRAVDNSDPDEIYRLLAPETIAKLNKLLHLANAQTGGRRKIKAKELLVAGMNRLPTTKAMEPGETKVKDNRATVEVLDGKKVVYKLQLMKSDQTKGRWRVVLPGETLEPPEPGPPASRPTSQAVENG